MERVGFFKKKERRWCHKGLSHDSGRQWRHYESRRWVLLIADDGESFEDDNPSLEPYSTRLIPRPASGPDQLTYTFGLFSSRNITSRGPHCTATSGDLSGCGEYPQLHPRTTGAPIGLVTMPHCPSSCDDGKWAST